MLQRFTNVSKQVHQIFQSLLNGYHKSFKASQMSQSFSNVSKLLKCFKVAQMLQSFSKFSKPLKIFKASPKFQSYQMFQSSQKYEIFQHHTQSVEFPDSREHDCTTGNYQARLQTVYTRLAILWWQIDILLSFTSRVKHVISVQQLPMPVRYSWKSRAMPFDMNHFEDHDTKFVKGTSCMWYQKLW